MASFELAIGKTLLWEGGYSNHPSDSGGETYEGISRNNWPNWPGWALLDSVQDKQTLRSNPTLQGLVVDFYRQNFWQYNGINDQDVASKVFDLSVNVGKYHGVKILQQAAGVETDGHYGPKTEGAVNAHPIGSLTSIIRVSAENYHREVVISHPEDAIFLANWLKRDDS